MKKIRYIIYLLLLLPLLAGCDFRDVLDDYPVSGVQIKLDWTGLETKLPEGMRVIFYPKDAEGRKVDTYLTSIEGGEVKVPPGRYDLLIYNYNTESVLIRDDEAFETIEAYTGFCKGLSTEETMVWAPDPLYVVRLKDMRVEKSDKVQLMEFQPELAIRHYMFEIKVKGLEYVSDVICNVSGMGGSYHMSTGTCSASVAPIYIETCKKNGTIRGTFSAFYEQMLPSTRAIDEVTMKLLLIKLDNSVQEEKVDITKSVTTPPDDDEEDPLTTIEVPVDKEIEVDKVEPEPGGGGGFDGDVNDWGDETEVILPVG